MPFLKIDKQTIEAFGKPCTKNEKYSGWNSKPVHARRHDD